MRPKHTRLYWYHLGTTLLWLFHSHVAVAFPQPTDAACHGDPDTTSRVCDVDGLLGLAAMRTVQLDIVEYERYNITCHEDVIGVQMGVYVVDTMHARIGTRLERLAKENAQAIHNEWGVGYDTACGGTGLLLYLAVGDRQLYISRGQAIRAVLTDSRLQYVIDRMKPELRDERYAAALHTGIGLLSKYIQDHRAGAKETMHGLIVLGWAILVVAALVTCQVSRRRKAQHEYRQWDEAFRQDLSKLDRDRAQALQGRYQATSCPICLEDFTVRDRVTGETRPLLQDAFTMHPSSSDFQREILGSDGLPVHLLSCGHVFDRHCWNELVRYQPDAALTCPICRQPIQTVTREPFQRGLPYWDDAAYQNEQRFRLQQMQTRYPRTFAGRQYLDEWCLYDYHSPQYRYNDSLMNDYLRRQREREAERARQAAASRDHSHYRTSNFGGGSADGGGVGSSW